MRLMAAFDPKENSVFPFWGNRRGTDSELIRLDEQLSRSRATPDEVAAALGWYAKRWRRWTAAGLGPLGLSGAKGIVG